jgi:hypothetical protein
VLEEKLTRYALSPEHPVGRHKARVFRAALGIELDGWEHLRDRILAGVRQPEAVVVAIRDVGTTKTAQIPLEIEGPGGRTATVVTVWRLYEGRPRLVTAYVGRRGPE